MKVSYNWLKEYINTSYSYNETANILTDIGLEVEKIEFGGHLEKDFNNIVTGKIIELQNHPNADKLKIAKVDVGDETLQIVCGAPNVLENKFVIVAKIGAILNSNKENELKISKVKIRGTESFGMICSQQELGLGEDNSGIWILNDCLNTGISAYEYFQLKEDYIFEIGLTPNRTDALGIIGVARDLAAYENFHKKKNLKINWPSVNDLSTSNVTEEIDIKIESLDCYRYSGVVIDNVNIQDSPSWLQNRLLDSGLKPINNVVDITNYVMLENGTPLHAFDLKSLNKKIVIKTDQKNQNFKTLDGNDITLNGQELMITNGSKPLCLAGVMGGLDSGISEQTQSIFIESAIFNPTAIRKTAKKHGISSDSSYRFERGVDPNLTIHALNRAADLIIQIAGGNTASVIYDLSKKSFDPIQIEISIDRINSLIGSTIQSNEIEEIINLLDFKILHKNDNNWIIQIPLYRHDVARECDVVEEILRIYGYNNIPLPTKMAFSLSYSSSNQNAYLLKNRLSNILVSNGFYEVMNNSLTKYSNESEEKKSVKILNPLSKDLEYLRSNLLDGILENIAYNSNRQNPHLKLFEIGKSYFNNVDSFQENENLGIAITGKLNHESWNNNSLNVTFFSLKGYVELLLQSTGMDLSELNENQIDQNSLEYTYGKNKIAEIISVTKQKMNEYGIKNDVYFASINLFELNRIIEKHKVISQDLPKSFSVKRDFALLLDEKVKFSHLKQSIKKLNIDHLNSINLFDVYQGEKLQKGKKSYAISFYFQDKTQTLKDETIDKHMSKIEKSLLENFNAELRR